jgi:hypothetical protein
MASALFLGCLRQRMLILLALVMAVLLALSAATVEVDLSSPSPTSASGTNSSMRHHVRAFLTKHSYHPVSPQLKHRRINVLAFQLPVTNPDLLDTSSLYVGILAVNPSAMEKPISSNNTSSKVCSVLFIS